MPPQPFDPVRDGGATVDDVDFDPIRDGGAIEDAEEGEAQAKEPGRPFGSLLLASQNPIQLGIQQATRAFKKTEGLNPVSFGANLFKENLKDSAQILAGTGKIVKGIVADTGLAIGETFLGDKKVGPLTENIRASLSQATTEALPIEQQLAELPGIGSGVTQGILSAAGSIPALAAGMATGGATTLGQAAAMGTALGLEAYGASENTGEAFKAGAIGAAFPVIGKVLKPLATRLTQSAVANGWIKSETAIKALETAVEQAGFQSIAQLMNVPSYLKASPEERSKMIAENTASLMVFAIPGVMKTFNANAPSEIKLRRMAGEVQARILAEDLATKAEAEKIPIMEAFAPTIPMTTTVAAGPRPRPGEQVPGGFQMTGPSGLRLAQERPVGTPGDIPANREMVELVAEQQPRAEVVRGPESARAQTFPPLEEGAEIPGTRRLSALERQGGATTGPSGQTVITPRMGQFLVDETGTVAKVSNPSNPTAQDISLMKQNAMLTANAIALSKTVSDQSNWTFYIDQGGRAVVGPVSESQGRVRIDLTWPERIKVEQEVERQIAEALTKAQEVVFAQPKVNPKTIDKNLPERPQMSSGESMQIATQFQQRVPSESARGETEFDRPANPQVRGPNEITVSGLEKWADDTIRESKKRMNAGLDPTVLAAYTVKGAMLLARGTRNIAEWSKAMIAEFGEGVKPHLQAIRRQAEQISNASPQQSRKGSQPAGALDLRIDTKSELPDLQPRDVAKSNFLEPFAAERIPVLGKYFGKRSNMNTPQENTVVLHAHEIETGKAIASSLGEQIFGKFDSQFRVGSDGNISNISRKSSDQSLRISDVMESLQRDPASYILNPGQKQAFKEIMELEKKFTILESKYGLTKDPDAARNVYFSRVVVEAPNKTDRVGSGRRPGTKMPSEHSRMFATEELGWSKGYKYEPSIEKRIVTRAERLYRRIADKRLSEDPDLGGKTRSAKESELRTAYADKLASGEMSEQQLQNIVDSLASKGAVNQPAFFGKIFDAETVSTLNKAFPNVDSQFRKKFIQGNSFLKGLRLSLDLGVGQLQGLVTLYNNPAAWKEAQVKSIQAIFKPEVFPEYVRNNLEYIRELSQLGSSVGRLQEMMAGTGKGEPLTQIKVVGPVFKAFGRNFQTFLDVAKVEMWKSYRDVTPRTEWPKMAQTIESMLFSGRMESVGVSQRQALLERSLLLAPSYYRGAINLVGALGESGASGKVARRAIGSYLAGSMMTFVGVGLLLGMDQEDLTKRMNPANGDFMLWEYKNENGKKVQFGIGGIYRSVLRLAGNVVKTATEKPENFLAFDSERNPFMRWYRGHAAPIPGLTWDAISGKDFMGIDSDVTTMAPSVLPMTAQQFLRSKGEPTTTGSEVALSFFGLTSFPQSPNAERKDILERIAKEKYERGFSDLNLGQMSDVRRTAQSDPAFANKPEATQRQIETARKFDMERTERIGKSLTVMPRLKELNLKVSGFEPAITLDGNRINLSPDQTKRFESLVIEEYNRVLTRDMLQVIQRVPVERRQDMLNDLLTKARGKARNKMMGILNKQ